jgi:PAS domain S-box-containing protein
VKTRSDFFILDISPTGDILDILHQQVKVGVDFSEKLNLYQMAEEGSREKLSRLLISLREQGRVANWELFLNPNGQSAHARLVYLGGVSQGDRTLLFGGNSPDRIQSAVDWLLSHPEGLPTEILKLLDPSVSSTPHVSDDQQTFDEMSRLYGELAAMQRDLAKKRSQLEQLNATIRRYANSLEEMVADRTRQLQESEARFRGIFEFSSLGIAILDANGTILSANHALSSIFEKISSGNRNANIVDVLYLPAEVDYKAIYAQLHQGDLAQYRFETVLDCEDGSRCWLEINFFIIPMENGLLPVAINLIEDITDRKDSEQALIQAEKLTTVGKIAASLAHEINNPLQAIMGNIDLASESLEKDDRAQRNLRVARDELQRVSRIVSDLRSAGRKPKQRKKSLASLDEIVDKIAGLVRKKCDEKGIDLNITQADSLPLVLMDSEQIEQVLLNLAVNAIEALPTGGKIIINSRHSKTPPGVEVLVSNDGEPISEDVRGRIFEPFYTTKEEGLGLGLHISRQIMDAHNGTIELLKDRKLTRFRVFLPEPVK